MITKLFSRIKYRLFWGFMFFVIGITTFPHLYCQADEIILKDRKVSNGTILEEDQISITIRIPKGNIESIKIDNGKKTLPENNPNHMKLSNREIGSQKNIEKILNRLDRIEKEIEVNRRKSPDQMIQDEMGTVKGTILWKGRPLADKEVKIKLDTYTGFSLASLKKMFSDNKEKPADQEITFTTRTNSQGRYSFEEVPPGEYKLSWMPDAETGWVHRLRDSPDFEVISGKLIVQNIPWDKK